MRFAYTDGTVHYEPDMCACGKMDTSGYCSYCCPFGIRLRMIGSMLVVEERYCSRGPFFYESGIEKDARS